MLCRTDDCERTDTHAKGLCSKCYRAERRRRTTRAKSVNDIADDKIAAELKREQTRKLRIENDIKENIVVDVVNVEARISEIADTMLDALEGIPARVSMDHPELSDDVLATLDDAIREAMEATCP